MINRARGFSLLELVVVLTIISVLIAVAIRKLPVWMAMAERSAVETVVGSLRSAISIKMSDYILRGNVNDLWQLENSNPMERLSEVPYNYIGELDNPDPVAIKGGTWYFDKRERVLVYLVSNASYFRTRLAGPARARFGVHVQFEDRNGNGRFDAATDKVEGLRLVVLDPYDWKAEVNPD